MARKRKTKTVKRTSQTKRHSSNNGQEIAMVRGLDELDQFERFSKMVPEDLRKDILAGMKSKEIYEKYGNMAAARAVIIMMTEEDPGKAMTAVKDILDRTQGRPIERKQHQHALHNVDDKEFDALLSSEMEDLDEMEGGEDDD